MGCHRAMLKNLLDILISFNDLEVNNPVGDCDSNRLVMTLKLLPRSEVPM